MGGNSALWGASSAIAWGVGDFSARFSGERSGVATTTFWMIVVSFAFTLVYALVLDIPIILSLNGSLYLICAGIGITAATGIFYEALTRGPVSIASPIVASYPAIALPISVALGARPGLWEWGAMGLTLIGVLIASQHSSDQTNSKQQFSKQIARRTSILAFLAAVLFALSIASLDLAIDSYGPTTTLLGVRVVGIICFLGWFIYQKKSPKASINAWWLLVLVGLLDTGGHLFLYIGLDSDHGEYAIVASSAYTVVTVLLARFFLRESVTGKQWIGIALVVAGLTSLTIIPS